MCLALPERRRCRNNGLAPAVRSSLTRQSHGTSFRGAVSPGGLRQPKHIRERASDNRTFSETAGSTMADWKERITFNPKQCGGRPCIRGMRIRVTDVLDLLASGLSTQEILDEMPDLEAEDIEAAIRFARSRIDHPVIAA